MSATLTLWMRHPSAVRALRGAAAMAVKYPGRRFCVGFDRTVACAPWVLLAVEVQS